ncbi:hypothetical protein IWQ57_004085 [Coemansia nantahalensis]|uniref:Uncharacterized protein n=1 Tax=Coemansia nantahalensis TaxID=2789366 RepID=A0ACC1JTQ7_9FUNG|nr:hypothetical protein IWQ57_004085 [Coemansia nantahalensis]
MWYVGRSDEPNNGLTHAGLTKSPLLVVWYWAKTVMALIVSGLAVPTAVLRFALATAPALFPIRLDEIGFYFTIANTVLVPAAVLVLVVERQRVRASAVDLFAKVSTAVAHAVRLTEYVTGKRAVSDEGRWVLKRAPWLDLWFVRPLMPSGVVDGCLEAMSDLQDKARAGDVDNAVPTSEYYAFLQKVIDDSLASTHPHLAFIVEPRNALVPNVHFLKKHDSRRVAIFVDDTGKPLDPLHDYETADDPGLRQAAIAQGRPVPAAAPHDEKSDLRFRREDYCVMYLPPWDDPREVAYLVLLQFAVGVAVLEVLISLWQIGKIVSGAVFGGLGSGLASISLGILVVSAVCAVARRRAWLLERIAHEGGAAAALSNALRAFRAASGIAWQVAVVLAVFAGAIPSLACYTAELYWGILYTGDVDVLPPAAGLLHALQGAVRRQLAKVLSGYIVYQVVVGRIGEVVFGGLGMLLRNPRRWPVRQWLARYAAPAICKLAALCVLPLGLALLDAALKGTASADMLWDLVRLRDAALLARHARVALLAMGALAVVFKAAALYVTCAQIVRDRLYAVGRELTNIDGTSTPGPQ